MSRPGSARAHLCAPLLFLALLAAAACRAETPASHRAQGAGPSASSLAGRTDLQPLRDEAARRPADPAAHLALGEALALAAGDGEGLDHLERSVELDPVDPRYGNAYRLASVRAGAYQRAIDFLQRQVTARPDVPALRLNLALAFVDKMPTDGLGIVGQGLLSNRSIRELNQVLERDPRSWIAMYGRAMNHLHWPRALLHASRAVADFKTCLALQRDVTPSALKPHHLLPYLGLGDAHVKNGEIAAARRVWREAESLFPGDPRLALRRSLGDAALQRFVEEERGLAKAIDTDLSFLWAP